MVAVHRFQMILMGMLIFEVLLNPCRAAEPFTVRRWTTDDGLPQNRISALAQTPDGYLWCGTWFGLVRFDGVRFTAFNRYNTPAMTDDAVNALAVGPDGALWVGTHNGLLRYSQGQWAAYGTKDGLAESAVWDLAFDADRLWVAAGREVGQFPRGPWLSGSWRNGSTEEPERKFVSLPGGTLASIQPLGFLPLAPPAATNLLGWPELSQDDYCLSASPDGKGGLWIGSWKGLWHGDGAGNWTATSIGPDWGGVKSLFRDIEGVLWVAFSLSGLHRMEADALVPVPLDPTPTRTQPTAFFEDRDGNLWIGTDNGLFLVRRRCITAHTCSEQPSLNEVWSLSEGRDGVIWLATGGGLALVNTGGIGGFTNWFPSIAQHCVVVDAAGTRWADEPGRPGLIAIRPNGNVHRFMEGVRVRSLYLDRDERLWVGTGKGPICLLDGAPNPLPSLPTNEVTCSLQTKDGAMWFGTKGDGLHRCVNGENHRYSAHDGLADDHIFCLHEDSEGVLWVGTQNGLSRIRAVNDPMGKQDPSRRGNPPLLVSFTTAQGLFDNLINQILEDDDKNLWFGCNRGIFRIPLADLNAVATGRHSGVACAVFGADDGMLIPETNGEHQPASCKSRDGLLWFPTPRGVVMLDPRKAQGIEKPPLVVIEEIVVDGQRLTSPFSGPLVFKPGRASVLQIRYTAASFASGGKVRFRYRLRGLGDFWLETGSERVAYFTNLKPGGYTFEVTAANSHGVWAEHPAVFAFTLDPRLSQTAWFPASLTLGGVTVAACFMLWRLRWQRRALEAEQTAAISEERARIARELHDDLGTALSGVALEIDLEGRFHQSGAGSPSRLAETSQRVRLLAERMREVVWAVNPQCDNVPSLAYFLEQQAVPFLRASNISCRLDFPDDLPRLKINSELRHQVALGVRELLLNIVRHSGATEATLKLEIGDRVLIVVVVDNGNGFNPETFIPTGGLGGNGLPNLRRRMHRLGGECILRSTPGEGTSVTLSVPLKGGVS